MYYDKKCVCVYVCVCVLLQHYILCYTHMYSSVTVKDKNGQHISWRVHCIGYTWLYKKT